MNESILKFLVCYNVNLYFSLALLISVHTEVLCRVMRLKVRVFIKTV